MSYEKKKKSLAESMLSDSHPLSMKSMGKAQKKEKKSPLHSEKSERSHWKKMESSGDRTASDYRG